MIFLLASKAEKHLISSGIPQTIIVCGDSGSGKTETTSHVVKQLCSNSELHELFSNANPLIETFGNAATERNSNSSRFVKLIQVIIFSHESCRLSNNNIISDRL